MIGMSSIRGLASAAAFVACATTQAQVLDSELVVSGLTRPVYVTSAPGDPDRIYIVEQRSGSTGRIQIFNLATGTLNPAPFFQITGLETGNEEGLLGLAFHPDYENNGLFYVNYTRQSATFVEEYQRSTFSDDFADTTSGRVIIRISQPFSNHNGGWIDFGPNDGYLYVATGDGGSANDPGNRSQDITNQLLGKMLRLDVDGDDFPADNLRNYAIPADNPFVGITGDDEIWQYGLRNPFRCSFDPVTGDLYQGDVGQNAVEEVNVVPGNTTGGENFGWRCYEGNNPFITGGCPDISTLTFPVQTYTRGGSPFRCSITGGEVYRGCRMPELSGTYFYADFCSNQIWSFRWDGGTGITDFQERTSELGPINSISSFGRDANGEIYICSLGGSVFRIIPADGSDGCVDCVADQNGDGEVDFFDVQQFLNAFAAQDPAADLTNDGLFDFFDVQEFLNLFAAGCP